MGKPSNGQVRITRTIPLDLEFTRGISTSTRRLNIQARNLSEVSFNSDSKVAGSEDLHPEYFVGLTDAEGCFMVLVRK